MSVKTMRHSGRIARLAKEWLSAHIQMWKFGTHGRRRFRQDPRYNLHHVSEGFKSYLDETSDDTQILERICAAYRRAKAEELRGCSDGHSCGCGGGGCNITAVPLKASIHALLTGDIAALRAMYRNFYRDVCSSELLAAPYGLSKAYFGGHIRDIYRHFYLSHVLYRLDYWKEVTGGHFTIRNLGGPRIGNPFGIVLHGTHIAVGSEYAHYCAQRVHSLRDGSELRRTSVAEVGCGFGAMAYYLFRDSQPLRYVGFDNAERVALSSYYLMRAFPKATVVLYGEKLLKAEVLTQAEITLLPMFALESMPPLSIDNTFSSGGLCSLTPEHTREYLRDITSMTRRSFLYIGRQRFSERIRALLTDERHGFAATDTRFSEWHSHKVSGAGVGGAAARSASTLLEQSFMRQPANPYGPDWMSVITGETEIVAEQAVL